jgi:hypothetical protein
MYEYYIVTTEDGMKHVLREHLIEVSEERFDCNTGVWIPYPELDYFLKDLADSLEYEMVSEKVAMKELKRLMAEPPFVSL